MMVVFGRWWQVMGLNAFLGLWTQVRHYQALFCLLPLSFWFPLFLCIVIWADSPSFAFVPYNNLTFIHYVLVILAATVKDWRPLNPIIFSSLFILSTLECLSLCISSQEINLPSSTWKTYERKTVTLIRHADTMLHKAIHFWYCVLLPF